MGENSEAPKSPSQTPDTTVNRRGAIKTIAGTVAGLGAAALGMPRVADAQSMFPEVSPPPEKPSIIPEAPPSFMTHSSETKPLKPADPNQKYESILPEMEIPDKFKEPVKKAATTASHYLSNGQEIMIEFQTGEVMGSAAKRGYRPQNFEVTGPGVYVRLSEIHQPTSQTLKDVWKVFAGIIRENNGDLLTDKFSDIVLEHAGIDLRHVEAGTASETEQVKLPKIMPYLDAGFYNSSIRKEVNASDSTKIPEELYDRTLSIGLAEPVKLAEGLASIRDEELRTELANIFGETLLLTARNAPVGAKWNSFGIDNKSIFKIIESSKNSQLKTAFENQIKARS